MRNLVIKREKSFVACLAKMKVYIEDATSNELIINNRCFRKIGVLKNGEEKAFLINEDECNIVVIVDKLSKNYCNDFCRIPAGENDVYLSGKNVMNPALGNAFRFNEVTDIEVLRNRNKASKKGIRLVSVSIVLGIILGFLLTTFIIINALNKPKVFEKEGMTITLNNRFKEVSSEKFTVRYDSDDVTVLALKDSFSQYEGLETYSLEQYGDFIINNNDLDSKLQKTDDLTYFEYQSEDPETKVIYHFYTVLYKSSDSFWSIQFGASEKDYNDNKQDIMEWIKDIEFSN